MPDEPQETARSLALFEALERQLQASSRQLEFLQAALDDTVRARKSLEGLAEEKSRELLVPLGASTFVRATVKDESQVIAGIGGGYATEKTRDEAVKRLSEREASLQKETERMVQSVVELQQQLLQLREQLEGPEGDLGG